MALNHSLTLTLGFKNEKRPSGTIELDLEAGNLVYFPPLECRNSLNVSVEMICGVLMELAWPLIEEEYQIHVSARYFKHELLIVGSFCTKP